MGICLQTTYFAATWLAKDCLVLCSNQQSWFPAEHQVCSHNELLFAFKVFAEADLDLLLLCSQESLWES